MDKKGATIAVESLVEISLWIIGFIIIIGVILILITTGQDAAQEVICRDSVILRSKANIAIPALGTTIAEFEKITPLQCDPVNVGVLEGSREEIKKQIAELSAKCWWMYLEGSVANLFDTKNKGERICNVCFYFRIPKELDEGLYEKGLFEEMTFDNYEFSLNQLKEGNVLAQSDIDLALDKKTGDYHLLKENNDEIIRFKNMISAQEIYNYLITQKYDPKLLYGGGTKQYMGDIQFFESGIIIPHRNAIELRNIKEFPTNFIQDFTGLIKPETMIKITETGSKLLQQKQSLMLVVVADEIDRNQRTDARRLIETLGMNSGKDKYDAILIIIDVYNKNIRMHVGGDLEYKIQEYELIMMMQEFDPIKTTDELNTKIQELMNNIDKKIITQEDRTTEAEIQIPQGTYYDYLSNRQTSSVIIEQLDSERTYAIVYLAQSDIKSWWAGVKDDYGLAVVIGVGVVVVIAAIIITATTAGTGTAFLGAITLGKVATVTTVAMATSSYLIFTEGDQNFAKSMKAIQGTMGDGVARNMLLILPAVSTDSFCTDFGTQ